MPAYPNQSTTAHFAELLTHLADAAGLTLDIEPAESRGWLVGDGEALVVYDPNADEEYLVTVRAVS